MVQYLVIKRVICFNMLRLQELKQEQEFGICKYTRSRSGVSTNRLRSFGLYVNIGIALPFVVASLSFHCVTQAFAGSTKGVRSPQFN